MTSPPPFPACLRAGLPRLPPPRGLLKRNGPGSGAHEPDVHCGLRFREASARRGALGVDLRRRKARASGATILASQLLNLHVRRCLDERQGAGLEDVFSATWIYKVFNEVTSGKGRPAVVAELRDTTERFMPAFNPVDRTGLQQILLYECRNLAAVAANNAWMHFRRRLLEHVRLAHALDDVSYLCRTRRSARRSGSTQCKIDLMRAAEDLARPQSEPRRSPPEMHAWIEDERDKLRIDAGVSDWAEIRRSPSSTTSSATQGASSTPCGGCAKRGRPWARGESRSTYPLRRALVPRHVRLDQI
ncbi:hypothetical protein AB1Y20_017749 [Prymnesium parvum]|uniref:Uncharacterized protein n=1 Tax=Prymnesium parvum TaxID=97485 RepID=A0AB34JNE8_PRYPA